ncbi:unnamed protein product [Protopolystoma xenopodis]|uniref:Uncharacterized protein n=1 Tax=Protopolystoma xenopodis TaxID=117903 RepID=A0A448WB56_9PLAT|nr:unnamed protein product [Protopolystoma xenopodis]
MQGRTSLLLHSLVPNTLYIIQVQSMRLASPTPQQSDQNMDGEQSALSKTNYYSPSDSGAKRLADPQLSDSSSSPSSRTSYFAASSPGASYSPPESRREAGFWTLPGLTSSLPLVSEPISVYLRTPDTNESPLVSNPDPLEGKGVDVSPLQPNWPDSTGSGLRGGWPLWRGQEANTRLDDTAQGSKAAGQLTSLGRQGRRPEYGGSWPISSSWHRKSSRKESFSVSSSASSLPCLAQICSGNPYSQVVRITTFRPSGIGAILIE